MKQNTITIREALIAMIEADLEFGYTPTDKLRLSTGRSEKECEEALEKAAEEGFIDYGGSVNEGWLTVAGKAFLFEGPIYDSNSYSGPAQFNKEKLKALLTYAETNPGPWDSAQGELPKPEDVENLAKALEVYSFNSQSPKHELKIPFGEYVIIEFESGWHADIASNESCVDLVCQRENAERLIGDDDDFATEGNEYRLSINVFEWESGDN